MNYRIKKVDMDLPKIVGKGYGTFWRFKGRYRVVKGSRGSKKSKTMALWIIYNMMKYPFKNGDRNQPTGLLPNTLVIRKVYRSLKDSCFTDLQWAINRLKADRFWKANLNPLELTFTPTGQKILFRGLDDPLKIASITVKEGNLCWCWIEEAYEIMRKDDFDLLDESIRGIVPDGLFKQITLTFNPWSDKHWMKKEFFDRTDPNVLAMTTTFKCNEWLDQSDIDKFEDMRLRNPRRYQVAGLGNWGVAEGLIYENWKEEKFELSQVSGYIHVLGLDFGYTNHPSAFFVGFLDRTGKKLYVWDEMYESGLSNQKIFEKITEMGCSKEKIIGDSAEPKSIAELKRLGLKHIEGAKKGPDSVNHGIQYIQDLEIIVHPRCANFITEISIYAWAKDRFGVTLNEPVKEYDHLMDAMRYAVEEYINKSGWLY